MVWLIKIWNMYPFRFDLAANKNNNNKNISGLNK